MSNEKEDAIEEAHSIKERNRGLGCALVTGAGLVIISIGILVGLYLIFG